MRLFSMVLAAALCVVIHSEALSGEVSVRDYNDAYFTGALHALAAREPQTTFLRYVQTNLKRYNDKLTSKDQIRADCPAKTLISIVTKSADEDRTRIALLLLSLRSPHECKDVVQMFFNNKSKRSFSRIYAALVLAYWGEQDGKEFLHHVLKHGAMSSSGFEYSYAGLGLYLLGDLPEDFRFSKVPNPLFPHLDNRLRQQIAPVGADRPHR